MRTPHGTEGHPDDLATAAYLDGTLPDGERGRFEAHLAGCDACRAGVHLLLSAAEGEAATVPPDLVDRARGLESGPRQGRGRSSLPVWIATAATLVLAAAAVFLLTRQQQPEVPGSPAIYRGDEADPFHPLSPPQGAAASRSGVVFRWRAVEGADRYILAISSENADPIATLETRAASTETEWRPPSDMGSPGRVIWKVRALSGGRVIAESRQMVLEIR